MSACMHLHLRISWVYLLHLHRLVVGSVQVERYYMGSSLDGEHLRFWAY